MSCTSEADSGGPFESISASTTEFPCVLVFGVFSSFVLWCDCPGSGVYRGNLPESPLLP
jgi:hypothetical protein